MPYFNYSHSCPVYATDFIIRNTHDDYANDAGIRAYTIVDLTSNSTVVTATSENAQNMVRCTENINFVFWIILEF